MLVIQMATSGCHKQNSQVFLINVSSICHSYTAIRGSFSFIIVVASDVISPVNCDSDLLP